MKQKGFEVLKKTKGWVVLPVMSMYQNLGSLGFTHPTFTLVFVQLPYLSNVFLHQFRADDADEAGVSAVGHSTGTQSLASPRWPKQQHSLGGLNAQVHKPLRLKTDKNNDIANSTQSDI